jgi:rod shape determining protein RodA
MATRLRGPASRLGSDPASPWRHLDVVLLGATLAIAGLGLLMVYSASRGDVTSAGLGATGIVQRQGLFVLGGMGLLAAAVIVDYRIWLHFAGVAYAGMLLLLLAVLSPLGTEIRGTQGWFDLGVFQLQPSEFGKVAMILALAAFAAAGGGLLDPRRLGSALLLVGVPMALILLQPDLGTMLVFVAITMGVLLVAGARPAHIAALTLAGVLGVVGIVQGGVLEDYQRDRLTAFVNPEGDVQRSAYNLDQAKTAIGNGGFTGTGLFEGSQKKLSYVPEQQTDFIFTVVGEELGFLGAATLLLLYGVVGWRIWRAALHARDFAGSLLCVGVLTMLVFQVFQNVGMTMGIMPITGIPLPLVSYGGSSAITFLVAIGLVLNVNMRRFS